MLCFVSHALMCAILAFDSPVCVYELESLVIVITMRFLIIGTEEYPHELIKLNFPQLLWHSLMT